MAFNLQALLETEVIDKLLAVMKIEDTKLANQMAGLGTRVGSVATWAEAPTVDQNGKAVNTGDTFVLTTKDGTHPAGVYSRKPDNSGWTDIPDINYDDLNIAQIIESAKAAPDSIVVGPDGVVTATEDGKFTTPLQIKNALVALNTALAVTYHPKGGLDTLKVVGANADENTQEFVTANQMAATFTVADVQAKYDAL